MKLSSIRIKDFKRFKDLSIENLPVTLRLVMLTGPNGSGKTSLFEAFNYWIACINERYEVDNEYHFRGSRSSTAQQPWRDAWDLITPIFHGASPTFAIGTSVKSNPTQTRKAFYIRSAYRHEPDFTSTGIHSVEEILINSNRASKLIASESRVFENYRRIAGENMLALYDPAGKKRTAEEITEKAIGQIRSSMKAVFDDLTLEGPGNPMTGGTFRFTKGTSSGVHYKNLSGGEKAAFDLLVDFIVKKDAFNDTIYCIDEPELHMHTRLQSRLLQELFKMVPDNSQLWISTHSIGMARMASDLYTKNPGEVAFLDFHGHDFDKTVVMEPAPPNRMYWKNMFSTALDDLAQLVVSKNIVLCEGKRIGTAGRKPSFDVTVYRQIFSGEDVEFLPLGGTSQVESDGKTFKQLLTAIASGTRIWSVFDRDDRAPHQIADLKKDNIYVLLRRDLESYLWDDEIIHELCERKNRQASASLIIEEKRRLLQDNTNYGVPIDDVKAIAGKLYKFVRDQLNLTGQGTDAEAFAIAVLAPIFSPKLAVYKELRQVVLAPI